MNLPLVCGWSAGRVAACLPLKGAAVSDLAVKIRRRRSNEAIAAHDAGLLEDFFLPGVTVIAGDGSVMTGRDQVMAAFRAQFAEPGFITFARTSLSVTLDQEGTRASESGKWVGSWDEGAEERSLSGTYLAAWRLEGDWRIESELFVTLTHRLKNKPKR